MDAKTFVIPDGNGGLDPNLLLNMNGGMGAWGNSPLWALIFLTFLGRGFGNWGFGGYDSNGGCNCGVTSQLSRIQETLNTNQGQTLLMDAIKGNSGSIHELATTIGCNHNAVTAAVNGVQNAIANLGNQMGMGNAQIINAINNGNMTLANTLQSCCCEVKTETLKMGYENQINNLQQSQLIQGGFNDTNVAMERGFANVGFNTQAQTTALAANNDANARAIIAKLDQIEDSRKDREITSLTAALASATAKAERQAELAPLYDAIKDIQGKQPSTAVVQYPNLIGVPAYQFLGTPYGGQFG